ncbi:hypothetical protein A1351_19265 [Methylosinus sp. R-45379]|uniref:hypothetical protein n=1 Tax=Methylosinus sp. R-45379 TaxID=980563 RepID=UPI0007C8A06E|nr:hypothetical protein [Methylosinus sp. R-45379]OAI23561.1 hypothetical protein A1351_19265 [Methylosinus sp. R-45379]
MLRMIGALLLKIAIAFAMSCLSLGAFVSYAASEPAPSAKTRVESTRVEQHAAPGRFSVSELPADRDGFSLLTIPAPGRYAIAAHSASGVAIGLVDMITGPGETAGAAGQRDGRLDLLLDAGVYKLRLFGAKGAMDKSAAGKARLTAEAFQEQGAREALAPGKTFSAELGDLAQRSYSLEVGASGRVGVEALGRALRDLRLWKASGELIDLSPARATIETRPGRQMTRLRLEGAVEPGRYIAIAYGGEPIVWPEGGTNQPFLLHLIEPASLAAGVANGVIGAFGSARFEAPASYDTFRLELPKPVAARLEARRGAGAPASAAIDKTSREPVAIVSLGGDGKTLGLIEVSGLEGQAFSLRALRRASRAPIETEGPNLVAMDVAGEGADEVPATALLARTENGKTRVLASDLPKIGGGRAYRGKFNLRGPTTLLFEATDSGPVAISVKGPRLRAIIEPAFGAAAARADGRLPSRYDLQAGFYFLSLEPLEGAVGIVDVTLGPPGLAPELPPRPSARAVISFGEHKLDRGASHFILANSAPGLLTGPRVIALPADLEKGAAPLSRPAATEYLLPVRLPRGGRILVIDDKGASAPAQITEEKIENDNRFATIRLPARAEPGALALVYAHDVETAAAEAVKERPPATISAAKPAWLDLSRDETREFRFDVAEGGLYRVETLGRLQTRLTLGAALAPHLGEGENNGPGHNALVTSYLRAGAYRAAVTARESAGHLGLSVKAVAMTTTAPISGEGAARAALDGGRGAVVPIDIPEDGFYRLDLTGLGKQWRARLEEADGWPLTTPGPLTRLTRRFEKGSYRLVVLPEDVEGRFVARLRRIVTPAPLEGHGPHALPFDAPQKLQWREPLAKSAPRDPDVWSFALAGDSDIALDVSEGIVAEIFDSARKSVGKFAAGRKFSGRLAAGAYRVEARSLAHDDRLDYRIALTSTQLQPGAPRFVDLPAALPFSIARDGVVDIASFGDKELIGALEDENGAVIERLEGRAEDWNVSLSRRLPAGAYRLRLDELKGAPQPAAVAEEQNAEDEGAATEGETVAQETEEPAEPEGVEMSLALPASAPAEALTFAGVKTVSGAGAHELALPAAQEGRLMIVAAQSTRETALSIEKREADGRWRVIGRERGLAPVAAWPAESGEWRASVWTIGGADAPVTLAARSLARTPRGYGDIALEPAPIEGLATKICVGLVAAPASALVSIGSAPASLAAGSAAGRLLAPASAGALAPQSECLWLLSRDDCAARARVAAFAPSGAEIPLTLGENDRAILPAAAPPSGKARLWLARSAFGQPGVSAGHGFAVAPGAALALAGKEPPRLWNAGDAQSLRLTARAIDVALAAPLRAGAQFSGVIPPLTAQPLVFDGAGALALDLPSGLAAFSAPEEPRAFAAFADGAPLSRRLEGARALWLVNLTDAPAPARVASSFERQEPITASRAIKRFYGAAGETAHLVEAQPGDRLVTAGGDAVFTGADGRVLRGRSLTLAGSGEATIAHAPGLVAAWIERAGKSPWPAAAPRDVSAPFAATLSGEAQAFALDVTAPIVVDIRTSAPAILAFTQNGAREVETFPAGVELHRYAAPGRALIEIFSPHDGALSGVLSIATTPVIPVTDGVNDPIALGPAGSALFTFEVTKAGEIGLGLRAEPDRAALRLLDVAGKTLGEGAAQILRLEPGRYFVEARAPTDAPATTLRLALRGLAPPPSGPPQEVAAEFLEKAGRKSGR